MRIQRVVNIAADDESDTRYNRVTEKTVGGDIYRRVTLGIQMKRLRPQNLFITSLTSGAFTRGVSAVCGHINYEKHDTRCEDGVHDESVREQEVATRGCNAFRECDMSNAAIPFLII